MISKNIKIGAGKEAVGYIICFGVVSFICVATKTAVCGCGLFDPMPLDKFSMSGMRIKSKTGNVMNSIEDLLEGEVSFCNETAIKNGVKIGMTCRDVFKMIR